MTNKLYTTFENLAISRINDGRDAPERYPRGPATDLSYGSDDTCTWTWQDASEFMGLSFLKCKICGASSQVVVMGGSGSLKMPCRDIAQTA